MNRSPLLRRTPMKRTGSLKRTPMERTPWTKADLDSLRKKKEPKPLREVFPDGREVLRGKLWQKRKWEVYMLDGQCCVECHKFLQPPCSQIDYERAEIHHVFGRGMHGSKRNDAVWIEINGRMIRILETLCHECHAKARIKSLLEEMRK